MKDLSKMYTVRTNFQYEPVFPLIQTIFLELVSSGQLNGMSCTNEQLNHHDAVDLWWKWNFFHLSQAVESLFQTLV